MRRTKNATMLRLCAFLFTLSWVCLGSAQDMRDHWIFGPGNHVQFTPSGPVFLGQVPMRSSEGVSSISDSVGNLVAYAYPGAVFDASFDTATNGALKWPCIDERGSTTTQGSLFLPGEQGLWHLFTIRGDSTGCGRYLYHDSIRISLATGLAELVNSSRIPVLPIQVSERLTAVRHGNGKDWWIVTTDSRGLGGAYSSSIVVIGMVDGQVEAVDSFRIASTGVVGELAVSPDGSRLAIASNRSTGDTLNNSFSLYAFDRCTGHVGAEMVFDYNRGTYGATFSPSGQLLYLSIQDSYVFGCGIIQVSIADGSYNIEHVYDCDGVEGRAISQLELGPDNKIYFAIVNNIADTALGFLNRLSFPDSTGLSCTVELDLLSMSGTGFYYGGLPNHPNYYLGPDPRCSGDTSTTSAVPLVPSPLEDWKVYPTVAGGSVKVESSSPEGEITVLDALGRVVIRVSLAEGKALLETRGWFSGTYRVILHDAGGYRGAKTIIRP